MNNYLSQSGTYSPACTTAAEIEISVPLLLIVYCLLIIFTNRATLQWQVKSKKCFVSVSLSLTFTPIITNMHIYINLPFTKHAECMSPMCSNTQENFVPWTRAMKAHLPRHHRTPRALAPSGPSRQTVSFARVSFVHLSQATHLFHALPWQTGITFKIRPLGREE